MILLDQFPDSLGTTTNPKTKPIVINKKRMNKYFPIWEYVRPADPNSPNIVFLLFSV